MTTRRDFLAGCSVLAAAAMLKPTMLCAASAVQNAGLRSSLRLAHFASHVGTIFRLLRTGRPRVRLELAEAQARPDARLQGAAAWESGQRRFSLLFRGSLDSGVEQDTHRLDHPALGRLELFLVPVLSRDTAHRYYEAIFNHHA